LDLSYQFFSIGADTVKESNKKIETIIGLIRRQWFSGLSQRSKAVSPPVLFTN